MPYWECYYHINWSTLNRQPLITDDMELILFEAIHTKANELRSKIFAVNAAYNHIHVAVSIPPAKAVADWIGKVKGYSSHVINEALKSEDPFRWQGGYGVMSFGSKRLPQVVSYVNNQKQHHANNTLNGYLEKTDE